MELNLERLNRLTLTDILDEELKKRHAQSLPEPRTEQGEYKASNGNEIRLKPLQEGVERLQLQADQKREEISRSLEICRAYQENTKRSEGLQAEILKGVQAGEDIYTLFLKAVEAISKMTSNTLFYSQIAGDLRSIYGRGLREIAPLTMELRDTEERLQKLYEAREREQDIDTQERINRSIRAHKLRIADLEERIKGKPA